MTDEQLNDLKEFWTTSLEQTERRIKIELTAELGGQINAVRDELREEMREGFASVGDAIAAIHDIADNHERRISSLERTAA